MSCTPDYSKMSRKMIRLGLSTTKCRRTVRFLCILTDTDLHPVCTLFCLSQPLGQQIVQSPSAQPSTFGPSRSRPASHPHRPSTTSPHPPPRPELLPLVRIVDSGGSEASCLQYACMYHPWVIHECLGETLVFLYVLRLSWRFGPLFWVSRVRFSMGYVRFSVYCMLVSRPPSLLGNPWPQYKSSGVQLKIILLEKS